MVAYQIHDHFSCISESKEQLLMIITGQGGSGKSFVIQALSNLLINKCRVCAYFGIAAFNIRGYTLHSLLQLPRYCSVTSNYTPGFVSQQT